MGPQNDGFGKAAPRYDNFACPCCPPVNSSKMSPSNNWGPSSHQHFCHGTFGVLNFETTQLQFRALLFVGGQGVFMIFYVFFIQKPYLGPDLAWQEYLSSGLKKKTSWSWYHGVSFIMGAADLLFVNQMVVEWGNPSTTRNDGCTAPLQKWMMPFMFQSGWLKSWKPCTKKPELIWTKDILLD